MLPQLYTKLADDSDYIILDTRSMKWGDFKFTNGFIKHYITEDQLLSPYLISLQYYNTITYEDIILLVNNIRDPYEVMPGTMIMIPKLVDIKQFVIDNTKSGKQLNK